MSINRKKGSILMLARTSGLQYDDRIRKEVISLRNMGFQVEILANYTNNLASHGTTEYGSSYRVFTLYSRKLFPSSRFLFFKMFEFWLRVFFHTLFKRYDFVWMHDEYMALNAFVKPVSAKYIYDLHELPNFFMRSSKMASAFKIIEKNTMSLIVANEARLNFMETKGLVRDISKYYILNNFPDSQFSQLPIRKLDPSLEDKLEGYEYILMQGGGYKGRYPMESLSAIKTHGRFKAIMVGPIDKAYERIISEEFKDMVIMTGYVNQMDLSIYIDNAWGSLVLYSHSSQNNILCEPNRLYQAICRGIPVIAGNNPSMRKIIQDSGAGVLLKSDGGNVGDIVDGIYNLEEQYLAIKQKAVARKDMYAWHQQEHIIAKLLASTPTH